MNETLGRFLLYGGAGAVLAVLGYTVAHQSEDADVLTLLSSADVQLRLAHGMPPVDKAGKPLESREDMIATAETQLVTVERLQPGMAVTAEFQGFAQMLRGRFAEAASSYARARQCGDCEAEQRDILAFNEARMLARSGKLDAALAVFAQHGKSLDARYGHQRALEEATILRQLGRQEEALTRLDTVRQDASAGPLASLQAGIEYLALGRFDTAEAVLEGLVAEVPIADYHLAQLKLQRGEVDRSLDLLERAAKAQPAEVRRRLQNEVAAWSAVAADARFLEISRSGPATPVR